MEGFEDAVKYINVYKIRIQWERLKLCISMHVEALKPAEEATDKTVQWFSALLHQALHRQQVYLLQI